MISTGLARLLVPALAAFLFGGGLGCRWNSDDGSPQGHRQEDEPLMTVHLFADPAGVRHFSRFRFVYENPAVLQDLRRQEGLDEVVAGARGDQETFRRLMGWVRDQWEPGRPDPYPPPEARIILRDIRQGVTGGFCAQYCFVLLQAITSFGAPARCVTVEGHEVIEAWLRDEKRWVMFDPLNDLQVIDNEGRSLSALEIWECADDPSVLQITTGNRCSEGQSTYLDRYRHFAVWLRNDFVSQPMNFTDFDRYRVWFDPSGVGAVPSASLRTSFALDLYPERVAAP